jgi:hypothetical protein
MIIPKLPIIPTPYKLLGILALCLGLFLYGYFKGVEITENAQAAKDRNDLLSIIEERDELEAKLAALEAKRQTKEVETRIVYRDIERKIEDATDNRICFTGESLSLWNEAIAGKSTVQAASGTPPPVPGAVGSATDEDVLRNAVTNFELAQRFRQRIIDIIEAHKVIHGDQ